MILSNNLAGLENLRSSSVVTAIVVRRPTPTALRARTWNTYVVLGRKLAIRMFSPDTRYTLLLSHFHLIIQHAIIIIVYLADFSRISAGGYAKSPTEESLESHSCRKNYSVQCQA